MESRPAVSHASADALAAFPAAASLFPSFRSAHSNGRESFNAESDTEVQSAYDWHDEDALAVEPTGHRSRSSSIALSHSSSFDRLDRAELSALDHDQFSDSDDEHGRDQSTLDRQQNLTSVLNNPNPSQLASGTSPALAMALPVVAGVQRSLLDWMGHSSTATPLPVASDLNSAASSLTSAFYSITSVMPTFLGGGRAEPAVDSRLSAKSAGVSKSDNFPTPPAWLSSAKEIDAQECVQSYLVEMKRSANQFFSLRKQNVASGDDESKISSVLHETPSGSLNGLVSASPAAVAEADRQFVACLSAVPAVYFRPDFRVTDLEFFKSVSESSALLLPEKLSHYLDLVEVNLLKQISCRSEAFFNALCTIQDLNAEVGSVCSSISRSREQINGLRQSLVETSESVLRGKRREANIISLETKLQTLHSLQKSQAAVSSLLINHEYIVAIQLIASIQQLIQTELQGLRCLRSIESRLIDTKKSLAKVMLDRFVELSSAPLLPDGDVTPLITDDSVKSLDPTGSGVEMIVLAVGLAQLDSLSEVIPLMRDRWLAGVKDAVRISLHSTLDLLDSERSSNAGDDESGKVPASGPPSLAQRLEKLDQPSFVRALDSVIATLRPWISRLSAVMGWLNAYDEQADALFAAATRALVSQLEPHVQSGQSNSSLPIPIRLNSSIANLVFPTQSSDAEKAKLNSRSGRIILGKSDGPSARNPLGVLLGSDRACAQLRTEWLELFASVSEFAHTRCARILETRKSNHTDLSLSDFQHLWDKVLDFVFFTEDLASPKALHVVQPRPWMPAPPATSSASHTPQAAPMVALRQTLVAQARDWLGSMYTRQRDALLEQLLVETWAVSPSGTPVLRAVQTMLDRSFSVVLESQNAILSGSASVSVHNTNWESRRWDDDADDSSGASGSSGRSVQIAGERFFSVNSLLTLFDNVNSLISVPFLLGGACGADALHRVVDAFNTFNSRACQLVLGAGAMQSARLKTITAKHLAVTSQCLGALLAALPLVRKALAPNLPGKQAHLLSALDVVAKDLEEHRREIFAKLVGMLADLIEKSASRLGAAISAATRSNLDALNESVFDVDVGVARLLDSTRMLHRALSGILATAERNQIFRSVVAAFSTRFATQLGTTSKDGHDASSHQNSILIRRKICNVNCRFIITELRKLEGVDTDACKELERFAN